MAGMIHRSKVASALAIVCTLLILTPQAGLASIDESSPLTISVTPLRDGDADQASRDLATVIGQGLGGIGSYHVVDSDLAARVLEYHGPEEQPHPRMAAAEEALSQAKDFYFQFRYLDSWDALQKAIGIIEEIDRHVSGPFLVDAYLTRALVAKARTDKEEVRRSFRKALGINPRLLLSDQDYSPSFIVLFEEEKGLLAKRPSGSIAVTTDPAAADVHLNGILQGQTPMELAHIPQGTYHLAIKANRYLPVERTIQVEGGRQVELKHRLRWASKNRKKRGRGDEDAGALVREGLRIADVLKVDKVILVDVDAADDGRATARVIDRRFGVGLKPVLAQGIHKSQSRAGKLARMTRSLAQQIGTNLENSPEKLIDPPGVGHPALLGRRRKPLHRHPVFWGAVGVVLAGALGGGLAAALSGGGHGPGSIRVQFQ